MIDVLWSENWDELLISRKITLHPELPEDVVMLMIKKNKHLLSLIEKLNLDLET
jgi:hypothetical protein